MMEINTIKTDGRKLAEQLHNAKDRQEEICLLVQAYIDGMQAGIQLEKKSLA